MKRRSRNRRRNRSNRLNFQKLEARQLLAGDVLGLHQAAGVLPAGENIVVNGDFESFTAGADNFYDQSEVPGWNAMDAATGQEINIFTYNVSGYDSVLDLDSTTADFDRVFQEVDTDVETEYLIAFDYRNHPTENPNATEFSYDFEVWWNFERVGRFTGGDAWQTGVIKVTSSNLDTTRLLFCEIQETGALGGDGQGALLDNIRVVKADEMTIINGGFETTAAVESIFHKPGEVTGWSAIAADVEDRLIQISDDDASEGTQYVNLDTTAELRDMLATEIATTAGASYYVLFDARTDGEQTISPDQLRVRWNNQWAGTILATSEWETYGLVLAAESSSTELMFLEPGETTGEGSGPHIDNVRVYEIGVVSSGDLTVDANGAEEGVDGDEVFYPGAGSQAIGRAITLDHSTGGELDSVVISLNGVVDGTSEILAVDASVIPAEGGVPKITVTGYDSTTRELTLSGIATTQEYQDVLNTLHYFNAAESVSTTSRLVNIRVSDLGVPGGASIAEAAIDLRIETNQAAIDDVILQKFIDDNGLVTTDLGNGLYAVIDEPGSGLNPTINSVVRVKYNGKFLELNNQNQLVEGESFDFSSDQGFTTSLGNVIQGWGLGIPAFKTGGVGKLLIPSHLAYGPSGQGSIPGDTVLIFDIELLEIIV